MVFTLRNDKFKTSIFFKAFWKNAAKQVILCYPMRTDEILLNKYLIQNYKTNLKFACIKLLLHSKQVLNEANELTIFWVDKRDQQLARLITFGTGRIPGSKILQAAFS